ncbi:unnamed protein product [Sphenostylis stenocarpa]|uniref:Uncharacterized protein n=1 Tax=Sphenostylis stenocarpa TaxID=92480 RepID=A0AA86W264_9FABA|nr:unnamed protein product [Sphenostylis stenocarpa]
MNLKMVPLLRSKTLSSVANFSRFQVITDSFNKQGNGTQNFTDAKIIITEGCCRCCCCTSSDLHGLLLKYWLFQSDTTKTFLRWKLLPPPDPILVRSLSQVWNISQNMLSRAGAVFTGISYVEAMHRMLVQVARPRCFPCCTLLTLSGAFTCTLKSDPQVIKNSVLNANVLGSQSVGLGGVVNSFNNLSEDIQEFHNATVKFEVSSCTSTSGVRFGVLANSFNNKGNGTQNFSNATIIIIGGCCSGSFDLHAEVLDAMSQKTYSTMKVMGYRTTAIQQSQFQDFAPIIILPFHVWILRLRRCLNVYNLLSHHWLQDGKIPTVDSATSTVSASGTFSSIGVSWVLLQLCLLHRLESEPER